jgi:hypothetical protein
VLPYFPPILFLFAFRAFFLELIVFAVEVATTIAKFLHIGPNRVQVDVERFGTHLEKVKEGWRGKPRGRGKKGGEGRTEVTFL